MSTPRSVVLERLTYTLAAPVLAAAPNTDPAGVVNTLVLLAGAAGAAEAGLAVKRVEGAGRKLVRLSPVVSALALDLAAIATPGWGWDAVLAAAWAATGFAVCPLSRGARSRFRPALAHTPTLQLEPAPAPEPAAIPAPAPEPGDFEAGVRHLWERASSPGRTVIAHVERHPGTDHDCTLLLRSAEPGRPISGLTGEAVAAAFGIEESDVVLKPVARQPGGRQGGPGWLEVQVIPDERERRRTRPTDAEWWADIIATNRGPLPGSVFGRKVRNDQRAVTYWTAQLPDTPGEPRINLPALCTALGASYEDGRVFITVDGTDLLVSVWDISPLAKVYPATRELLTPDADGRWVVGYLTNGQPARNRVYTDRGAAHGLYVAPSGGGKTQLMALSVCADANYGAVVWIASEAADQKTSDLGAHVDRQGVGALYTVRALRAAAALMEIRAEMEWADGRRHDFSPGAPGCPYAPLSLYLDEFLSAARHEEYGEEIMNLAELVSVKGRKYGVGEKVAGQSVYVQDGFTQLLCENLRELSIPVVLRVAPKKISDMFKALGVVPEDTPSPLPRSFSKTETGRIDRIMRGEPEPQTAANTGGVGWIIEGKRPEVLRTLYMDFDAGIDGLFPEQTTRLTAYEITELEARGLWFDWTEPPRPGEFGPIPDGEQGADAARSSGAKRGSGQRRDTITTPRQALDAIKRLTNA
ncbi:chromosome segregation protein ParM [Streptomyces sp. NPDC095602]|uniref:chromosome segregation protein ParM n=1 Tax=Streptomyces sp. NPDC095602 TaxID=3155819 RepID=UPI003321EEC1